MHIKLNDLFLEMQEQLDRNQAVLDDALLIELVNRILPNDTRNQDEVQAKFNAFVQAILITPDAASTLQSFVLKLTYFTYFFFTSFLFHYLHISYLYNST